jgi:hypothetical protein
MTQKNARCFTPDAAASSILQTLPVHIDKASNPWPIAHANALDTLGPR